MLLLFIYLLSQISSSEYDYTLVHENAEMAKVVQLEDGSVLALSSGLNSQNINITKYNNRAQEIYKNSKISKGYAASAEVVESKDATNTEKKYYLFGHNRQNLSGQKPNERILAFNDKATSVKEINLKNSLYRKTSVIPLKSGKLFIAGIIPINTFGEETKIEINIYNPVIEKFVENAGTTFPAYGNFVSCYEQKDNDIYCAYTSKENIFISKLSMMHLKVAENRVHIESDSVIVKNFYTVFNYLKAIKFNENEGLILYQTGNAETEEMPYGNSGKDLYFYQISTAGGVVDILRYEYLYNGCLYRKDAEYYNADIIALSDKKIYAICEYKENAFYGFGIVAGQKHIDRFEFNDTDVDSIKNPVLAKFDKTLGLFFTYVSKNGNSKVVLTLINCPSCEDYGEEVFLPRRYDKQLNLKAKIFMSNIYPSLKDLEKKEENVTLRITKSPNITVKNADTEKEIKLNEDFDSKTNLIFYTYSNEGEYNVEYTASKVDPDDGLVLGKTCKISFNTPKCLDQCNSCNQTGTEKNHFCYGCKNESYYINNYVKYFGEEFDQLHDCHKCNESCFSCYGPFISSPKEDMTTNCIRCYYEEGFYPYENNNKTCISEDTQDYWEEIFENGIYLDKSGGDKEKWVWRKCHENCRKCFEKGDEKDNKCDFCKENLFFFCNQTKANGGIPGSCHANCVNNGFYNITKENRQKCCPCLNFCKECKNDTICEKCDNDHFLVPDKKKCNESCGYCLAEDTVERECVNCKDRGEFTLNKTCVNTTFYKNFSYHIIDDKCSLLMGCKEGCYKCDPWYTDKCTECKDKYYKEDFFGKKPQPETFRCFNQSQCRGVTPYVNDENVKVGGVPIRENGTDVCLNCKLRNNSYRLPENDFYCGEKRNRTYVDIEEYNKLSECYFRCKSCNDWGNSYYMNCTSCRESKNFDHFIFDAKKNTGNCLRKNHKCGIYPYYHDYDIAEVLGIDEEDCGENCDVCLYNFSCTERFPYFVYESHECVEYCPIMEVLGRKCDMNNSVAATILLLNPFGLKNPYDFINSTISINDFISSSLIQYIADSYNLDSSTILNYMNNYVGNGKVYNLPESQIISGNNITIELTTLKLELEKLAKLLGEYNETDTDNDNNNNDKSSSSTNNKNISSQTEPKKNTSILNISECQDFLKKKYNLPEEEELIIVKGDVLHQLSEEYLGNTVDYQLFSTSLGAFLPLADCQNEGTTVLISNPFTSSNILSQFQSKTGAAVDNGYDPFDAYSSFYNDICTPFTNENGNDVLLDARRKDYFNENANLCESGCKFVEYSTTTNMYTCICNIKAIPGETAPEYTGDYVMKKMPENFRDLISKRSNIEIFKCASQVFSAKGQKKNFGSYILLFALACFIGVIAFHFIKEKGQMKILFEKLIPHNIISSHPKRGQKESISENIAEGVKESSDRKLPQNYQKENKENKENNENKEIKEIKENNEIKNVNKDICLTEDQLNYASFNKVKKNDKRELIKIYWSLLKMKQLFIFTFYTSGDYILRSTKISLFILFIGFYLTFTALFFNDDIMRAIYIYKGNTDAAVHIPNIILSSLCCLISNLIIRFVSLNEREISKILEIKKEDERKRNAEKMEKIAKIKLIILYIISGILLSLFWYYVSAFCAVFKNSQGHYFTNVLVSFIICNLWPCAISFIPAFLRKKAIEKNSKTMYTISQIISYF